MANDPCGLVCFTGIGFFVGVGMIWDGVSKYLLRQKIMNTPTSKVRSVALGMTEVFGKARCKENHLSPIAKQKCIYHKVIGEYYRSGKHGGWKNIYTNETRDPFYLEDETGKILVDPKLAEIDIPRDNLYEGYIAGKGMFGFQKKQMDAKVLQFISALPPIPKGSFMAHANEDVRISEFYIAEGDDLYVLGTAVQRPEATGGISHENLMVKRGRDDTFYISDSQEKKLENKMRSTYLWEIPLGFLLAAICLFFLVLSITSGV